MFEQSVGYYLGGLFKSFKYFRSFNDSKSLRTNKIIVLVCGALSTGLAFIISTLGGNLTQISAGLNGAFNAPMLGLFLLGLFFSLTNTKGVIGGTVIGFMASLWISIGAYVVKPVHPKLPVSTEMCFNLTNLSIKNSSILASRMSHEGFEKFYYMSYMWYTTFGTLTTVLFGVIISVLTGGLKLNNRIEKSFMLFDVFWFYNRNKNVN